jgi:DNA-binding NtrC family response regulator
MSEGNSHVSPRSKARILIVDDEPETRAPFAELLERWGHQVVQTADGHEALKLVAEMHPDLIVSDLVMPKLDGLQLVRALREEQPDTPVVIITGRGTIDVAVEAVREGVFDFVEKPLDPARLKVILQRALEKKETMREMQVLRRRLGQLHGAQSAGGLIGNAPAMRKALELVAKVAPSKASVVITGQSGTGKEMVARAIHDLSPRRDKPFIAINCSAIPASLMESEMFGHERGAFTGADQRRLGCWELADGGTLFLDEVGEIPFELQAKFLRVLEEERLRRLGGKSEIALDVRVISATNRDLKEEIRVQRFREDLYFRLNVFHIPLAPLKERREDVPLLVQHFIDKFSREGGVRVQGVASAALKLLEEYAWPGNIRELRNTLERAVILCGGGVIDVEHLPPDISSSCATESAYFKLPYGLPLREIEKEYILASLNRLQNNKSRTAVALGISEKTLYNKLSRYAGKLPGKREGGDAESEAEGREEADETGPSAETPRAPLRAAAD